MRYLLVTFIRKPNGQIDEQIEVAMRVRDKDIQMCNVIVDFKEKKVEKCLIEGRVINNSFDQLKDYYTKIYPAIIERLEREAEQ
jgi:hypothetical protein